VHLRVSRNAAGDVHAKWVRRSRAGWGWLDDIDAPLGESSERYRITFESQAGSVVLETKVAEVTIPSSQVAALEPGPVNFSVVQVGDYAGSRPATTIIN